MVLFNDWVNIVFYVVEVKMIIDDIFEGIYIMEFYIMNVCMC